MESQVELIVLNVKEKAMRCRYLSENKSITLQNTKNLEVVAGMIITVQPNKIWSFNKTNYMSGKIISSKIDIDALNLKPLKLREFGKWDPEDHYWGDEDEPREEWELAIIKNGPRLEFEMEQVNPLKDPDDFDSDPIMDAIELKNSGDVQESYELLSKMLEEDLRCIDAHTTLGNMDFNHSPEIALSHYEIGVKIGEQAIGRHHGEVFSWSCFDNRPFLRALHGYGLALWKCKRFEDALKVFEKMLWLNPSDNQGIRFLIDDVRAGREWKDRSV